MDQSSPKSGKQIENLQEQKHFDEKNYDSNQFIRTSALVEPKLTGFQKEKNWLSQVKSGFDC